MPWNVGTGSGTLDEVEILKKPDGLDSIQSVVLMAAECWPDATASPQVDGGVAPGTARRFRAGTILTKVPNDALKRFKRFRPVGGLDVERQQVAVNATGGTYTLTFNGQTTAAIAFNATAVQLETALELLNNIQAVTVTGGPGNAGATTPYVVEFHDPAGDVAAMTSTATGLTGGTASAAVTTLQAGIADAGLEIIEGILLDDVEFVDNSSKSDEAAPMIWHTAVFDKTKIVDYATHEDALKAALATCRFL